MHPTVSFVTIINGSQSVQDGDRKLTDPANLGLGPVSVILINVGRPPPETWRAIALKPAVPNYYVPKN